MKCWLLDPCRDLKYIQLFESDSNSVTQSDTNNMYSNCRCIITLKTSHDSSLPTTSWYKCGEKQQSATQTLLIFSAHDTRGTHSLALHSKQWTCRNFPFPLKGSSPSFCSSPEARGASQSPPSGSSGSFHLLHSVSICPAVLTFLSHSPFYCQILSVLALQIFTPWIITICLSLSDAVSFSLRCECCSQERDAVSQSHPSEMQVTPHNKAAHSNTDTLHICLLSHLWFQTHHKHLHYHQIFKYMHKEEEFMLFFQ